MSNVNQNMQTERKIAIVEYIASNAGCDAKTVADSLGLNLTTARNLMRDLVRGGLLIKKPAPNTSIAATYTVNAAKTEEDVEPAFTPAGAIDVSSPKTLAALWKPTNDMGEMR